MSKKLQIHRYKSFKNVTGIKYFIISVTGNQNWIKFGVGFLVALPNKTH